MGVRSARTRALQPIPRGLRDATVRPCPARETTPSRRVRPDRRSNRGRFARRGAFRPGGAAQAADSRASRLSLHVEPQAKPPTSRRCAAPGDRARTGLRRCWRRCSPRRGRPTASRWRRRTRCRSAGVPARCDAGRRPGRPDGVPHWATATYRWRRRHRVVRGAAAAAAFAVAHRLPAEVAGGCGRERRRRRRSSPIRARGRLVGEDREAPSGVSTVWRVAIIGGLLRLPVVGAVVGCRGHRSPGAGAAIRAGAPDGRRGRGGERARGARGGKNATARCAAPRRSSRRGSRGEAGAARRPGRRRRRAGRRRGRRARACGRSRRSTARSGLAGSLSRCRRGHRRGRV